MKLISLITKCRFLNPLNQMSYGVFVPRRMITCINYTIAAYYYDTLLINESKISKLKTEN